MQIKSLDKKLRKLDAAMTHAKDDPSLVKEVIARLRAAGEIELDDLVYLDRIADRWISIAEGNRHKARSAHPR